ncbi:MAG: stage III sporulation protein AF [Anaerostipes sp.]|nr:stage III sporulation protein AF [Anaerostipes sp.]MDD3747011.1 stage III sporulation protein AF [Anaerostipes sp.]
MQYIKSILVFLMLSSFVEQIVPNKSYLPYLKIIIGCMLLIMIFQPLKLDSVDSIETIYEKIKENENDESNFYNKRNQNINIYQQEKYDKN